MFTGIVQAVGRIAAVTAQADGARVVVSTGAMDIEDVGIGDSIAVNGCCLTVIAKDRGRTSLAFDVSGETLRCTVGFADGAGVNLEKALRLADRLGGHLVSGHVDGVGTVREFAAVGTQQAGAPSWRLLIEAPHDLSRFIAGKGSIAVNGVSLTVNLVDGNRFDVNLIPHTLDATTLRDVVPGAKVNLEVDVVARYVLRMLEVTPSGTPSGT